MKHRIFFLCILAFGCAGEKHMIVESYDKDDLAKQASKIKDLNKKVDTHAQDFDSKLKELETSLSELIDDVACKCSKETNLPNPDVPEVKAAEDTWSVRKYSATWCGPCQRYNKAAIQVPVEEFDVSDRSVWGQYSLQAIPAFDICKNGTPVWRWRPNKNTRPPTPQEINNKINQLRGVSSTQSYETDYIVETVPVTKQVRVKVPGSGWNEGRSACGNRACSMCYSQYRIENVTTYQKVRKAVSRPKIKTNLSDTTTEGQQPTPDKEIEAAINSLNLSSDDKLVDLGCGDGRVLIAAVRASGCRAVGVEIDPAKAAVARQNVSDAGLEDRIEIVTGDVLEFDPAAYGVTKAFVYLYTDLLTELKPTFEKIGMVASPFHPLPGLKTTYSNNIHLYQS